MNQNINIYALLFFIVGSIFLIRNIAFYFKPQSLRNYMEKSPKALLWRNKFGIEKTIKLGQWIFLPLGIIVSTIMMVFGFKWGIMPLL